MEKEIKGFFNVFSGIQTVIKSDVFNLHFLNLDAFEFPEFSAMVTPAGEFWKMMCIPLDNAPLWGNLFKSDY